MKLKFLLSLVLLLGLSFKAYSTDIISASGDSLFVKVERLENGSLGFKRCLTKNQKEDVCADEFIGGKAFSKSYLLERIEKLDKKVKNKKLIRIGTSVGVAFVFGIVSAGLSTVASLSDDVKNMAKVFTFTAAASGTVSYGITSLIHELIHRDLFEKEEASNAAEEALGKDTVLVDMDIEDFIGSLSDVLLEE